MYNEKFKVSFRITRGEEVLYAQKAGDRKPYITVNSNSEQQEPQSVPQPPVQQPQQPAPPTYPQPPVIPAANPNLTQQTTPAPEPETSNVIYRSSPDSPVQFTVTRGKPVYKNTHQQTNKKQLKPIVQAMKHAYPQYDPRTYPVCVYKHPQINFNRPIKEELYPVLSLMLDIIDDYYGRSYTIEVSRKLGLYYMDKGANSTESQGVKRQNDAAPQQQQRQQQTPQPPKQAPEPNKPQQQIRNNQTSSQPIQKPTTGLYVQQPKTAEEIEAEEMSSRVENVAMGFPGEPVVETMRFKQQIPLLKQRVTDRLNNFAADQTNEVLNFNYIKENIEALIKEDVARLMNTDLNGFDVNVTSTVDHKNVKCYDAHVTNYANPIFIIRIYPAQSNADKNSERMQQRKIASGINLVENDSMPLIPPVPTPPPIKIANEDPQQSTRVMSLGDFCWDRVQFHFNDIFRLFERDYDRKMVMYGELLEDITKFSSIGRREAEKLAAQYVQMAFPFEKKPTLSIEDNIDMPIDNDQNQSIDSSTSSVDPVIEL